MIATFATCPNCNNKIPSEWKTNAWICPSCKYIIPAEGSQTVPKWFANEYPDCKVFVSSTASKNFIDIHIDRGTTLLNFSFEKSNDIIKQKAEELIKEQKYDEALDDLNSRISIDSMNIDLRYQRALCIYSIENPNTNQLKIAHDDLNFLDRQPFSKNLSEGLRTMKKFTGKNKVLNDSVKSLTNDFKSTTNRDELLRIFNINRTRVLENITEFFLLAEDCQIKNILSKDNYSNTKKQMKDLLQQLDKTAIEINGESNIKHCTNLQGMTGNRKKLLKKTFNKILQD